MLSCKGTTTHPGFIVMRASPRSARFFLSSRALAANSGLHAGAPAGQPDSGFHGPGGMGVPRGRRNSGSGISVLRRAHGEYALELARPGIAYGVDRVLAIGVRAVDVR